LSDLANFLTTQWVARLSTTAERLVLGTVVRHIGITGKLYYPMF